MNSYSRDLRERMVKASQDQMATQAEIGATFGISVSIIQDWLKQYETMGGVEPLPRGHEHPLTSTRDGKRGLLLAGAEDRTGIRAIMVTRKDVTEIQLAKSAIRTGIDILMDRAGISLDQVERLVIAGAFGTYIDPGNACRIGMFPPLPVWQIRQVGNAAGMGAVSLLLSRSLRDEVAERVKRFEYIELTAQPDFQDRFIDNLLL